MKKIPTLYLRDPATKLRYVKNEVHPDCQWVIDGEGVPTYKWDGTAVKIDDSLRMWKRREVKKGKPAPDGFVEETHDTVTGKRTGWVPVYTDDPSSRWHWEAYHGTYTGDLRPGTYELIGPKIQGNPHGAVEHMLIPHGQHQLDGVPTAFDALAAWLHDPTADHGIDHGFEGVVWWHPDGRMAKIKVKDFPQP